MYIFVQALCPSLVVEVGTLIRASVCYHIRYAQNNLFWFASDVSLSVYIRLKVVMMYSRSCACIWLYVLKLCCVDVSYLRQVAIAVIALRFCYV